MLAALRIFASFLGAAIWWVLDRLHGDAIFAAIRPMIPALVSDVTLEAAITYGPAVTLVGLGLLFSLLAMKRGALSRRDADAAPPIGRVPIYLQNLKIMSNTEIRLLTANLSERLRTLQNGYSLAQSDLWRRYPDSEDRLRNNPKKNAAYDDEWDRIHDAYASEYRAQLHPEVVALYDELRRRVGRISANGYEDADSFFLRHGSFAGSNPASSIATQLEDLARQIPDQ